MKQIAALVFVSTAAIAVPALAQTQGDTTQATPLPPTTSPVICNAKCHFNRDRKALRRKTSREPLPTYITMCESHGYLHAQNSSGAGGRYQIMPSTWESNLPPRRPVRLAGGDRGPTWSSRLLQDMVAANVRDSSGLSAWSCA